MLDIKNVVMDNPLLQSIKADLEAIITDGTQANNVLVMTDDMRHEILTLLVTYSAQIPHPASGNNIQSNTLIRWQILAYVASIDLTIVKWFESHLDALSILHEVDYAKAVKGSVPKLWAVWASEGHPLHFQQDKVYQQGKVGGSKAWCSGAHIVDYALMTYRDEHGHSQLLIVDMQQDGIAIDNSAWQAVGMQATDTATVQFTEVAAEQVGAANAYLERVGFWHGAAGVAACWYGPATYLAGYLLKAYQLKPNDYKAMYLGQISTALAVTRQYFYHVANLIDTQPQHSHELAIRALRANVEQLARQVLENVGQALGAAPLCNNAHFARLSADLPVFVRQSHGAFDLQKIGELSSTLAGESANNLPNKTTDGHSKRQENIWQL